MNLRYLVPALGVLISSTGALYAENAGGLSIGGFVDTTGVYERSDDGTTVSKSAGFNSAAELRIGYKVGDQVTAQVDVEFNNNNSNTGSHQDTYLEQAYVNYAVTSKFSVTSGKFSTYAGWVSPDADSLWRINAGPIAELYGTELLGVAGNFAPSEDLAISVFLVNGLNLLGDTSEFNGSTDSRLALAVDALYEVKDVGKFNLEAGYDSPSKDVTNIEVGLNATLHFASYDPLTVGAEVIFVKGKDATAATDSTDDRTGFLLMGNHKIPGAPFPMSGTLMAQVVQQAEDDGTPGGTTDTSTKELSLALLTQPTGDSHFGLNAELAYEIVSVDTTGVDDVDTISFAIEAIAIIP